VAGLPEAAQRELLTAGDPAERVWSIWALGLRLGEGVLGDLQQDLDLEASPGVRCQLIVVMAGLGERDLVRAAALEDPDPVVRAVASQYVIRTLPAGAEAAVAFAIDRMRGDGPRVQQAIFDEVQSGRLQLPESVLLEFLAHPVVETRQLALEVLAVLPQPSAAALEALVDRALAEPEPLVRRALIELCLRRGLAPHLVRAGHAAYPSLVCEILSASKRAGARLRWPNLAPLARRPEPEIALAVLTSLLNPPELDAIEWMSRSAAALLAIPSIARTGSSPLRDFQWTALQLLFQAIAPETIHLFERSVAQTLLEQIDQTDDDDWGDERQSVDERTSEDLRAKRELLVRRLADAHGD